MNSNTSANTNTNTDIEINLDLVKNHTFGFHQKLELICHATRHLIDFPRRLPPPADIVKYFKSEISRRKCHYFGAPGSGDYLENQQKLAQLESHLTVLQAILNPPIEDLSPNKKSSPPKSQSPTPSALPTQSSVLSPFNSPPPPPPSQSQIHDPAYVLPPIERKPDSKPANKPDTHADTPLSAKANLFMRKEETGELVPVSFEKIAAIIAKASPAKTVAPGAPADPPAPADPLSQLSSLEREILTHIQPRSPLDRLSAQRLAELTDLLEHYSDNEVLRVITLPEAHGGWGIKTSRTALIEFRKRHQIIREKEELKEVLEIDPSAADSYLKHLLQKRLLRTLKHPRSETSDIRNLYQIKLRQQTLVLNEQRLALAKEKAATPLPNRPRAQEDSPNNPAPVTLPTLVETDVSRFTSIPQPPTNPTIVGDEVTSLTLTQPTHPPIASHSQTDADTEPRPPLGS